MCVSDRATSQWNRPGFLLPQASGCGLLSPSRCVYVRVFFSYLWSNGSAFVCLMFVCVFSEVCVDKARADEYEQRALELAQKVSEFSCLPTLLLSVCLSSVHLFSFSKPSLVYFFSFFFLLHPSFFIEACGL